MTKVSCLPSAEAFRPQKVFDFQVVSFVVALLVQPRANLTSCSLGRPEFGAVAQLIFDFPLAEQVCAFLNWPWKSFIESLSVLCLLVMLRECDLTASTPWWLSLALTSCVFQAFLGQRPCQCCPGTSQAKALPCSEPRWEFKVRQAGGKRRQILICSTF